MSDRMPAYAAARKWAEAHGHQQPDDRMVDAAIDALGLTTEHGLVFNGDLTDVRTSEHPNPTFAELWVRRNAHDRGGAVAIREATPWRLETPQEKS